MAKWINTVLAVLVIGGIGLVSYSLATPNKPAASNLNLAANQLKVESSTPGKLSSNTLTADSPPTGTSPSLQTGQTSLDQATTQPLQSDANINDPSVASSPLAQSILDSQQ